MSLLAKRMHSTAKSSILNRANGKGKEILSKTTTSRYNKSQLADSCDNETNITFPYHRPADNSEILPCYTSGKLFHIKMSTVLANNIFISVLSRSQDEGIGMKDLDQLQQELEKLLSASAVRSRILSSEFEHIDRVEERHEKKGKLFDKVF